ncbi:MAG: hypothetical protein F4106_00005 [Gemmatimonadetes bacterium]|nr:hypothetical protein [Gemmatimonadota bacterium]MXX70841.1 hypothetical protein [Gemmatimonadota bacterium]MYC93207.1 hypothetical protein [Gemmatimonadota bacterium]MYG34614.1 hypothetical protein [Gemmatimonadota bacterium]MYJ16437.1 hypothetical protein [Gemmatimonadota bacterium]
MSQENRPWRRLVFAAWAVFAVSFVLPAYVQGSSELGWEAFLNALLFGEMTGRVSAATNLLVLASLATLRAKWTQSRLVGGRWLPLVVGGAGVLNLVYWPIWVADSNSVEGLLAGYWLWAASFLGVALGLWMLSSKRQM